MGGGKDGEPEDYKLRIEARRLKLKKQEALDQQTILRNLEQVHEQTEKDAADVRAMNDHAHPDGDQQVTRKRDKGHHDPDTVAFENASQE